MDLKRALTASTHLLRRARKLLGRGRKALKRTIEAQDIVEVVKLTSQGLLAWSMPEPAWWPVSSLFGRLEVAAHPTRTRKEAACVAALIPGTGVANDPYRILVENWANHYGERFQYLRAWRPGGWTPQIDMVGADHVSAALARGRGIILFGGNFSFNNLVAKMAMSRLKLEVVGFSSPRHPFSKTTFGVRYLNRLYRVIENRYLKERLMPQPAQIPAALQRMREHLKANGTVYFTAGGRGRRAAAAEFLGYRFIIATGPFAMAEALGAAILPIYTRRVGSSRYEVTFGPPIEIPKDADGSPDYSAAVQAYADALTPFVLRDPGQWRGWRLIRARQPWGGKHRSGLN